MDNSTVFINMALKAWNGQLKIADKLFNSFEDDTLKNEIAPGKNSVLYLLGHLIAVNDSMLGLFGQQRLYSQYDEPFVKSPDKSGQTLPDAATLRHDWQILNEELNNCFSTLKPEEWFGKHSAMTDEDLAKEPTRNKLSVLIGRTNHMAYHIGQIVLAKR